MNATDLKLSPTDRAIYKRALIQAGQTTAGLTDAALMAAYRQLALKPQVAPKPKAAPKPAPEPELPDAAAQLMALAKQLADESKASRAAVTESRIVELIEEHAPRILREMLSAMLTKGAQ